MDITPLAAIRIWLTTVGNCPGLIALIAGRIYGPPGFPKPAIAGMPQNAVTYYQSGSVVHLDLDIDQVLITFRCYGATMVDADAVFRALDNCLHRATCLSTGTTPNRTLGYTAFRTSGPQDVIEPDTEWPCCWAVYRVRYWEGLI